MSVCGVCIGRHVGSSKSDSDQYASTSTSSSSSFSVVNSTCVVAAVSGNHVVRTLAVTVGQRLAAALARRRRAVSLRSSSVKEAQTASVTISLIHVRLFSYMYYATKIFIRLAFFTSFK